MRNAPVCIECKKAAASNFSHPPLHLVHPSTGQLNLFDTFGEAVCPKCGSRWQRRANNAVLVAAGGTRRKAPLRIGTQPVRKSA